eukprot:scaffold131660_cov51-Attheya_sp.AAC.1
MNTGSSGGRSTSRRLILAFPCDSSSISCLSSRESSNVGMRVGRIWRGVSTTIVGATPQQQQHSFRQCSFHHTFGNDRPNNKQQAADADADASCITCSRSGTEKALDVALWPSSNSRKQHHRVVIPQYSLHNTMVPNAKSLYSYTGSRSIGSHNNAKQSLRFISIFNMNFPSTNTHHANDAVHRTTNNNTSIPIISKDNKPEWHVPQFMEGESLHAKEEWLKSLLRNKNRPTKQQQTHLQISSMVDAHAYYVVLKACCDKTENVHTAPHKAEEWMRRLLRHEKEESKHCPNNGIPSSTTTTTTTTSLQPTVEMYNAVLRSWSNYTKDDVPVAARAETWFQALLRDPRIQPTTESFHTFLDICSKGHHPKRRPQVLLANAQKAKETLMEMLKRHKDQTTKYADAPNLMPTMMPPQVAVVPTTESFNYVIRAYSRCRNRGCDMGDPKQIAKKIMSLVRAMESNQRQHQIEQSNNPFSVPESQIQPNTRTYCMTMDIWGVVAGWEAQKGFKNRQRTKHFQNSNNVLDGIQQIAEVEGILKYMHDLEEAGRENAAPNTVAYNLWIGAWTRTAHPYNPEAPMRAERVLRRMMVLRDNQKLFANNIIAPDETSYNHVIRAWAKTKRRNSGKRAEFWLNHMWQEYRQEEESGLENNRPCPSVMTYNIVMDAYLQPLEADPFQAETLLEELVAGGDIGKRGLAKPLYPNVESFSLVMRAWAKAEKGRLIDPGLGCRKAYECLQTVLKLEADETGRIASTPDLFATVLNACH